MINNVTLMAGSQVITRRENPSKKADSRTDDVSFNNLLAEADSQTGKTGDQDEPGVETLTQAAGSMAESRPLVQDDQAESRQKTGETVPVIRPAAGRAEVKQPVTAGGSKQTAELIAITAASLGGTTAVQAGTVLPDAASAMGAAQPDMAAVTPLSAAWVKAELTVAAAVVSSDTQGATGILSNLAGEQPDDLTTIAQPSETAPDDEKKEKTDHSRQLGHDLQTGAGGELTGAKALGRLLAKETQPVSQRAAASRPTTQEAAEPQLAQGEKLEKPQPAGEKMVAASAEIPAVSRMQPETAGAQAAESSPAVQVADRVHEAVKHHRFQLAMKLQPEGLGQLSLKMAYQDGRLTLHILADTPQAQSILSQQMGELKSILESQHVMVDRMQVSLEKQEQPLWSNGGFHHFQEQGRQKGQNLNHRRFQPATNIRAAAGAAYYQPQYSQGILNDRA